MTLTLMSDKSTFGMASISMNPSEPNERAALDVAIAFSLPFGRHWRRASEPERWTVQFG